MATPIFSTGFLVHDVSRLRKKIVDKALKPLGITRSQWWVLVNMARYAPEDGIAQTELADLMSISKVSLGRLIDRMEVTGWLKRLPDPQDRRAYRVVMTANGIALLTEMQDIASDINKKIMRGISKEGNKLLDGFLRQMKRNLLDLEQD